jgi:hypothetical protein
LFIAVVAVFFMIAPDRAACLAVFTPGSERIERIPDEGFFVSIIEIS